EFCNKRRWISLHQFQQKYVICKMLPGPVAYQMALAIGYLLKGVRGGLVCGLAFLIPGALLILIVSIFYTALKKWSFYNDLSEGLRLGAFFIIFESTMRLAKPEWNNWKNRFYIFIAACGMFLFPRFEPLIIIITGLIFLITANSKSNTLRSDIILFQL